MINFEGLQQQVYTNQIVNHFIVEYDAIFLEDGEKSPFTNTNVQVWYMLYMM